MAANISFKQQCPSCETMVTIKDDSLIGKKIDCPKCKYRFVVEEPVDEEEEEFEEEESPAPAKKKGKAAKGKAGKKSRDDDDDEDRPKSKKEGGSKKLLWGLVIGGAAVILLAVAGVLIFVMGGSGSDKKSAGTSPAPPPRSGSPVAQQNVPDEDAPPKEEKKKEEPAKITAEVPTNLLPNDTEMVVNVMPQELLASPLGRSAFDTPGAFQRNQFQNTFGFPLDDLERILVATNLAQKWNFCVIRASKPVKPDAVKKALHLKKAEDSTQGQEYFTIASDWLNKELSRLNDPNLSKLPIPITPGPHPLAVRFYDPQTIVVADLTPMKKFLADKGQPAALSKPGQGGDKKPEGEESSGGRGKFGMAMGGGGGPPGGGGGPPNMQEMMQRMSGGRGGSPGGGTESHAPAASKSYLTVKPNLKAMLDRMEAKGPVVFSMAFDTSQWKESLKGLPQFQFVKVEDLAMPKFMGFALGMKEKFTGLIGMEFPNADAARENVNQISTQLSNLAQFGPMIHMKIEVPRGGGMMGGAGGMGGPGGMNPEEMRRRMQGGRGGAPDGAPGIPPPPGGNQPPGGNPPPGGNQAPGGRGQSEADQNIGTIKVEVGSNEKIVQLSVEVTLKQQAMEIVEKKLAEAWVRAHGEIASAMAPTTPHRLAQALVAYRDNNGSFPRGTFARTPSPDRQGRPWPPDQRISWMAELLPLLGYSEIYHKIDPQKSWRDEDNLLPATALIPEFLDGRIPNRSHFIHYANVPSEVAATDFVGMAGVGMDAASYDEKDAEVAKKLGIFGYDRVTKVTDIADGLPNTIALIQVPSAYKNPWLAGGGATVRGCPETGSVKPFVSEQPDGKKGTIAIMADGSVRFIADNIPDDVFKAMCTIKGGEKVDLNKYTMLIPPPPNETAELETTPEPPTAPPKKEEKAPPKKESPKADAKKEVDKE